MNTSIVPQDFLASSLIFEIAARSAVSHQLTDKERGVLGEAFLENQLNEEEHRTVNRLYRALRRGYLKLV